ncbi:MAG: alpha/beta hydrolase [Pirellulaceae bacterium]|nr:alpha/beta hydrolase [Pirellulaceae bacterium]
MPTAARLTVLSLLCFIASNASLPAAEVVKLWPGGRAPGDTLQLAAEADTSEPGKGLVAGRPIIRLGNVSQPEIHYYAAPADKANGTCIVICPGGGHRILAWDLEGTEVAEWLNGLGISAAVLKYRVPARTENPRYTAAVQDAQRALSLVRSRASQWKIDANKIGILGFSAGGETAALATILPERLYPKADQTDDVAWKPNFAVLIYPAYLVNKTGTQLQEHVKVDSQTPPIFFAHAANDSVLPHSSVLLWLELKKHKVPSELHIYSQGGHGYGLRATELPVTGWPAACAAWLKTEKWID